MQKEKSYCTTNDWSKWSAWNSKQNLKILNNAWFEKENEKKKLLWCQKGGSLTLTLCFDCRIYASIDCTRVAVNFQVLPFLFCRSDIVYVDKRNHLVQPDSTKRFPPHHWQIDDDTDLKICFMWYFFGLKAAVSVPVMALKASIKYSLEISQSVKCSMCSVCRGSISWLHSCIISLLTNWHVLNDSTFT